MGFDRAPMALPESPAQVAALLDHAILHPSIDHTAMVADLESLRETGIASVCIKPHAVALASDVLAGSGVPVCTVVGFPHGTSRADVKAVETAHAMDDGATEIDMVVNIGLVRSRDAVGVRADISAVLNVVRERNGLLKVIFENDFLPEDELKIELCAICSELAVDFVKTSTGFGYVKRDDGRFTTLGATEADLRLMRKHSAPSVGVKASGGIRSLDDALRAVAAGANRLGTTSTHVILQQARERFLA